METHSWSLIHAKVCITKFLFKRFQMFNSILFHKCNSNYYIYEDKVCGTNDSEWSNPIDHKPSGFSRCFSLFKNINFWWKISTYFSVQIQKFHVKLPVLFLIDKKHKYCGMFFAPIFLVILIPTTFSCIWYVLSSIVYSVYSN